MSDVPHQQVAYDTLQGSCPCLYRGPLNLITRDEPETLCCKAKHLVASSSFDCTLLNKKIKHPDFCWGCNKRKV